MFKLRELEKRDIEIINKWRNKGEVIDKLGAPFRYINTDVDYKWFENYMNNRNNTVRCAIVAEDDVIIGLISLTNIDYLNQNAKLHIMIGESNNQGKGIGTFAVKEMLKHAFMNMNLYRVELQVLESNIIAQKLYEKVGFKKEGVKRSCVYKNGDFVNMHEYSILKSEFLNKNYD